MSTGISIGRPTLGTHRKTYWNIYTGRTIGIPTRRRPDEGPTEISAGGNIERLEDLLEDLLEGPMSHIWVLHVSEEGRCC